MPDTEQLVIQFPEEEDPTKDPANKPLGTPDDLEIAVELLGSLEFATRLEAAEALIDGRALQKLDWHEIHSTEEAREAIYELACFYNQVERERAEAPRVSDVVNELHGLITAINKLFQKLDTLHPETRNALQRMGHPVEIDFAGSHESHVKVWQMALVGGLPPGTRGRKRNVTEHDWLDRLAALAAWTQATINSFVANYGTGDMRRPDAGGQRNMFMHHGGPPLWRLTRGAYSLFEAHRPGEANSTKEGPFQQFVAAIYRYATGSSDGEDSKVEHTIRGVIKLQKAIQPLTETLLRFDDALKKMPWDSAKPNSKNRGSREVRKWEIEQEHQRVAEEVEELNYKLCLETALAPRRARNSTD